MSRDVIGDFLTTIRNGIQVSKNVVSVPFSKNKYEIAQILKDEGFIKRVEIDELDSIKKNINIYLKYVDGESVIHEIKRISKPSKRNYVRVNEIQPVIGGLGISILTTNRGILTDKKAKELLLGGEVICTVW